METGGEREVVLMSAVPPSATPHGGEPRSAPGAPATRSSAADVGTGGPEREGA